MSMNYELLYDLPEEEDLGVEQQNGPRAFQSSPSEALDLVGKEENKLVLRLFGAKNGLSPSSISFVGTARSEGCSSICVRTARALSRSTTSSICVVDANYSSPSLHTIFNMAGQEGVAEFIRGKDSVRTFVRQVGGSNLWLLPCGSSLSAYREPNAPEQLRLCITQLRREFQYVLIDSPPLCQFADAAVVGSATDGLVVVIKANTTRRETTRRSIEDLKSARLRVFGIVLTGRKFPIPDAIYRRI